MIQVESTKEEEMHGRGQIHLLKKHAQNDKEPTCNYNTHVMPDVILINQEDENEELRWNAMLFSERTLSKKPRRI